VLKVLEDQGLLRATGKTIVVFGARPKVKPKSSLATRNTQRERVHVPDDDDDE